MRGSGGESSVCGIRASGCHACSQLEGGWFKMCNPIGTVCKRTKRHRRSSALVLLWILGTCVLMAVAATSWAQVSVEILKPTMGEKVILKGAAPYPQISLQGVVHIPDHPEKEAEAIIVWQMLIGDYYVMASSMSGEEKDVTLDVPFPDWNGAFGNRVLSAIVNKFQVIGNDRYNGPDGLRVIVLEETEENFEGWIVNSTDPGEQDMVIGQSTEDLEGCTYVIDGYCIHPHKSIPDAGLIFLQPWTSDDPEHWAYWIKRAIRHGNQNGFAHQDKLAALWYIADRAAYYNALLDEIGYDPVDGPTRPWETDLTPPTTPLVLDDGNVTSDNTQLHASWISEDPESGIARYAYAIGTSVGEDNVVGWTVTPNSEVTEIGLGLLSGQEYYFSVKAMNEAGLWSTAGASDGIIVVLLEPMLALDPQTLNLDGRGSWVTLYIELDEPFDVADIDASTVTLAGVPASDKFAELGDYDDDNSTDLMVKFDRSEIIIKIREILADRTGPTQDGMVLIDHRQRVELVVEGIVGETPFHSDVAVSVIEPQGDLTADADMSVTSSLLEEGVKVSYQLTQYGPVRLCVYDVTGRLVRTLVDGSRPAGRHEITWDRKTDSGLRVPAGVFFIRMEQHGRASVQKLLILD